MLPGPMTADVALFTKGRTTVVRTTMALVRRSQAIITTERVIHECRTYDVRKVVVNRVKFTIAVRLSYGLRNCSKLISFACCCLSDIYIGLTFIKLF